MFTHLCLQFFFWKVTQNLGMSMFSPKPRLTSSEVISSQSFFINVVKVFILKLYNLRKLENDLYFKLLSSNQSVNLFYIFKRKSLKALLRSNTFEAFNSSIVIIVISLMKLFYNFLFDFLFL